MSADNHNACPACYHRATGVPFAEINQTEHLNRADEADLDEEALPEYYETYIENGQVVFYYQGADCQDCGYSIPEFKISHPIPLPESDGQ